MRSFDELVSEAESADVTGWGFDWLDGRATEERPPWATPGSWSEIHRVLLPAGSYLAQHVGPGSAFELVEFFLGPQPVQRSAREPDTEARAVEDAGLVITGLRTARCRMDFRDVGAVVYVLRKCVWWVPDFTVDRYSDRLVELDRLIRREGRYVAHSPATSSRRGVPGEDSARCRPGTRPAHLLRWGHGPAHCDPQ